MEEPGGGRRREIFSTSLLTFIHLLLVSACAPWIGGQMMGCTSFRPSGGAEKIRESESFVRSLILLIIFLGFCQCLIRPRGPKYSRNKQMLNVKISSLLLQLKPINKHQFFFDFCPQKYMNRSGFQRI